MEQSAAENQQVMGPVGRFTRDYASMKTVCIDFTKDVSFEDFKPQFLAKLKGKKLEKYILNREYENELDSEDEEHLAQCMYTTAYWTHYKQARSLAILELLATLHIKPGSY